jgi:preprotein translocase subunit SecA
MLKFQWSKPMRGQIKEGKEKKTDMSKMAANKSQIDAAGQDYGANENDYYDPSNIKQEPVRVEKVPGRNEPCPCGSGKNTNNVMVRMLNCK